MDKLHEFSSVTIDKDCSELNGHHENELFFNCKFDTLNGLTLKDCELNQSEFTTANVRDALGFTMTLGCMSFRGVKYSPLLFDLFLLMAYLSRGNDEKRQKLLDIIGRQRAAAMLRLLGVTE